MGQKTIGVDDEKKFRHFYEKRVAAEVDGEPLGEAFKGYTFKISGGNDKQGFPMKQGVITNQRVRLLLAKGHSCYRPRRTGERKRKSVRGCIVAQHIAVLNLVVVKKGDAEIEGVTDVNRPRRLGPKRAANIRKLFDLTKDDDVRKFVIRRELPAKEGKKAQSKAPKIQRLVTPITLQRKRHLKALKVRARSKAKSVKSAYEKLLHERIREERAKKQAIA